MLTFKELAAMYHKGLLTPELRRSLKQELRDKQLLEKQKFFKTNDGRRIDLTLLQENILDKSGSPVVKLPKK